MAHKNNEQTKWAHLKVGDKVWLRSRWSDHADIRTVTGRTETNVYLGPRREYDTFRVSDGWQRGAEGSIDRKAIFAIATPTEVEEWEKEQASKAAKLRQNEDVREQQTKKIEELSTPIASFNAWVTFSDHHAPTFAINGLTEGQVKAVTALLTKTPA
jgi:hypothetical protein